MNKNNLARIASEYMQVWNAGNDYVLDRLAARDIEVEYTHFEVPYHGIAEYKIMLKMTWGFFPDLRIKLNKVIACPESKSATILWEYTGTHRNGNLFGAGPTGKKITISGMTLLEMEDELVRKESGIADNLSLVKQLGVFTGTR
jgi:steroid delta-isomerase-like uncharacterized protein